MLPTFIFKFFDNFFTLLVVREIPCNTHLLACEPVTAFAPPACNGNETACPEVTQL